MKLLLLLSLLPLSGFAKQLPNSSAEFISACRLAADCELRLFTELSKTFRPSRKEDELRDYVLALARTAEQSVWQQKLELFQDKIGNVMVRLPATGRFTKLKAAPFALQSHMDMVLAYVDAKPGEDLEKYFRDGVALEVKDGWIQAEGNRTTLGADNGIGVAIALRYLIDNSLPHPPLELIFTVQEEIGLFGAAQFEIPITSRKMLCLDGMTPEEGMIIAGSQAGHTEVIRFTSAGAEESAPGSDVLLRVAVAKMAGGHSGGDIHRNRKNALRLLAELIEELEDKGLPARLGKITVGDGILNKIPNLFEAEIFLPSAKTDPNLALASKEFLKSRIAANPDDFRDAEVTVILVPGKAGPVTSPDFSRLLAGSILAAPNGVVDTDPGFVNSVLSSNNLGAFKLTPGSGNFSAELGFMTRSFLNDRRGAITDQLRTIFSNPALAASFSSEVRSSYPAWLEPETSSLLQDALTRSGYFTKKFYLPAGLEPSAFKQRLPDLEVIAIGPLIQFAHSVKEKMKLDSIPRTVSGVRKIVELQ